MVRHRPESKLQNEKCSILDIDLFIYLFKYIYPTSVRNMRAIRIGKHGSMYNIHYVHHHTHRTLVSIYWFGVTIHFGVGASFKQKSKVKFKYLFFLWVYETNIVLKMYSNCLLYYSKRMNVSVRFSIFNRIAKNKNSSNFNTSITLQSVISIRLHK